MSAPIGKSWQAPIDLVSPEGDRVRGVVVGPEGRATAPVIVHLRDDSLAADASFYPFLTERLVGEGFAVASIDRPTDNRITPTTELSRVQALVGALVARTVDPRAAGGRVGLVGHGLGGAIALLAASAAAHDAATRDLVPGVVTLGACATLDRGPRAPHDAFAEDVHRGGARLSIEAAARAFPGRFVIVHGEEDAVVPIEEAERLYHWSAKDRARLIVLEKVGHSFGARDPMLEKTKEVDRIGKILVDFFRSCLG